ncbi:MAG: Gfo/Idh/MocA family oxidoreductase [bacterium]|nr:MAG: Gfo/Idh/MocA family oxidoreductase [bacterium]
MEKKYSRREFIKNASTTSLGLSIGVSAFSSKSYSRIIGANDRVNFAVIGLHGRGKEHIESIAACSNAMVTHICDVDSRELDKATVLMNEKFGVSPKEEKDVRKLLELKDIDAITIATPEHWHTPMSIMALQAGKHVYVEKPPSHNPAEGELLVKAQKKYGKLIQMGNQQRSSPHTIEAIQKIHDGVMGKAYFGKTWYSNNRKSIGFGKKIPVPEYLDWELWQGPAPRRPYKDIYHPYNWHWFWHWGTGETLNNGTHEVDLCLWALDVKYPLRISASGGRYHFKDDWEFYDTLVTSFEYEDKMITWEGKSCNNMEYYGRGRGVTIHGTEGTVLIDRNGYEIYNYDGEKIFEYVKEEKDITMGIAGGGPMTDMHFQNFINAIRSGEKLNSPIEEGNVSATMLLLSNIAWKVGRTLNLDPSNGHILKDKKAMKMWSREYESGWEPKI